MPRTTFSIVNTIVSCIFAFVEKPWKIIDVGLHFAIVLNTFWRTCSLLFRHHLLDVFLDAFVSIFNRKLSPKRHSFLQDSVGPAQKIHPPAQKVVSPDAPALQPSFFIVFRLISGAIFKLLPPRNRPLASQGRPKTLQKPIRDAAIRSFDSSSIWD